MKGIEEMQLNYNLKNQIRIEINNKAIIKFWNKACGGMALAVGHYEILTQGMKCWNLKEFPVKPDGIL